MECSMQDHIKEWDNILKEPMLPSSQSWDVSASWDVAGDVYEYGEVCCYTTLCLVCHKTRQQTYRPAAWDIFICPECRYRILRDGMLVVEYLHSIIQDLSRKRYREEDFFIRLDHILKTLKIDHLIVDYNFEFSNCTRKFVSGHCTLAMGTLFKDIKKPLFTLNLN